MELKLWVRLIFLINLPVISIKFCMQKMYLILYSNLYDKEKKKLL